MSEWFQWRRKEVYRYYISLTSIPSRPISSQNFPECSATSSNRCFSIFSLFQYISNICYFSHQMLVVIPVCRPFNSLGVEEVDMGWKQGGVGWKENEIVVRHIQIMSVYILLRWMCKLLLKHNVSTHYVIMIMRIGHSRLWV